MRVLANNMSKLHPNTFDHPALAEYFDQATDSTPIPFGTSSMRVMVIIVKAVLIFPFVRGPLGKRTNSENTIKRQQYKMLSGVRGSLISLTIVFLG